MKKKQALTELNLAPKAISVLSLDFWVPHFLSKTHRALVSVDERSQRLTSIKLHVTLLNIAQSKRTPSQYIHENNRGDDYDGDGDAYFHNMSVS